LETGALNKDLKIYHLFYERECEDRENVELSIGYFLLKEDAISVMKELRIKPGFMDFPEGFVVDEITLGHYGFRDGFESILGPPPKDACGEVFDVPL
jgi:hypothetical protein